LAALLWLKERDIAKEINWSPVLTSAGKPAATEPREAISAAQYVRMSIEHQRYSAENQSDAILQYAVRYGFDIVQTYSDKARSGLRIDGRDALKQLLTDVESGAAGVKVILVYDVSRWGRFQD
jgi:DNA invertase Pin-like site-specific DNA recombinase